MGVAIAFLFAGLLVGLVVGYGFGRKKATMAKAAKMAAGAAAAAAALAKMLGASEMEAYENDEDKDEEKGEGDEEEKMSALERDFLSFDAAPGIDDHPDLYVNPIVMYNVKLAKENERVAKLLEQLVEAARDPEQETPADVEIPTDEELAAMGPREKAMLVAKLQKGGNVKVSSGVGSVAGKVRRWGSTKNSSAILVDSGASFSAIKAAKTDSDSEKLARELREKLRSIDGYLDRNLGIDIQKNTAKKTRLGKSGLVQTALEIATKTAKQPFGGASQQRSDQLAVYASRGRLRVGPPLDHTLSAAARAGMRRGSCGGRRGSVQKGACKGSEAAGEEGGGEAAEKEKAEEAE